MKGFLCCASDGKGKGVTKEGSFEASQVKRKECFAVVSRRGRPLEDAGRHKVREGDASNSGGGRHKVEGDMGHVHLCMRCYEIHEDLSIGSFTGLHCWRLSRAMDGVSRLFHARLTRTTPPVRSQTK